MKKKQPSADSFSSQKLLLPAIEPEDLVSGIDSGALQLGLIRSGRRDVKLSASLSLRITPVYETYWKFAAERQALFMRRVSGAAPPWTDDPILRVYRFTNAYRAADRVTQYLIRHVLYDGEQTAEEIFFRCLLFKFFNRIETWEEMASKLGTPSWKRFDFERYSHLLDEMVRRGESIYSAAYIMPSPHFGDRRKHRNHLLLLEQMMREQTPAKIEKAHSLESIFRILRSYPSIGDFLAFQYTIDLNYSQLVDFSEMDFVVPGPGAREGIRKCFSQPNVCDYPDIIKAMSDRAQQEFDSLGLRFADLWGRPLQLIDCQNLFCEVGKYSRVAHPELTDSSGRTRIKQRFVARPAPMRQWYPPKWKLKLPASLCF